MIERRFSAFATYLLLFIFLFNHPIFSQTFNSWDGKWIKPVGTYRSLNILVNIIYDVNPKLNPDADTTAKWPYTTIEGINNPNSIPNFLLDFQDVKPRKDRESGTLTSLYSESSFGKFIILGEFIIVNVKHSSIKKNGDPFNNTELISSINNLINAKGGLKTAALYGKTDFAEYDKNGNQKFDIVQYLLRNTNLTFGGTNIGTGSASNSDIPVPINLGLNTSAASSDWYSLNGMGAGNFSLSYKSILFHELSHGLFGDNSFHTTGGNHYGNPYTCTFMGSQGGYGLMGAAASSLISCNGYERWRLNWQGPTNNLYPIAANNVNSDITIQDGTKTFYLRDFVTYGDAIRIKLPYKDNVSSSEQYIWLENHQVGHNEKLDFFQYAEVECVPLGTAGIYAYYQVGKDIRSSSKASEVWPTDETDNLRPILADGNWDYSPALSIIG